MYCMVRATFNHQGEENRMDESERRRRELKAQVAWHGVPYYVLAPEVGVNPGRLGQMLNGNLPLSDEVAESLSQALSRRTPPSAA